MGLGSAILSGLIVGMVLWRRMRLGWWGMVLGLAGLVVLCLGAGGVALKWTGRATVVVMVDCSASTRGARYREAGMLRRRVDELLGGRLARVVYFSDHNIEGKLDRQPEEMESPRTVFSPPEGVETVVLFSDGQFELPTVTPRVFAVVDPMLDGPDDAAVTGMEQVGDRVLVRTRVRGVGRMICIDGKSQSIVPPGQAVVAKVAVDSAIMARFDKGDAWPENDAMELRSMREMGQRWWVGSAVPEGWISYSTDRLPIDPAAYMDPSIIVLNNVSAHLLGDIQQRRLEQYVRDLGGVVLIVGGDQSFLAGGDVRGALEELSPLSSHAPGPSAHWVVLVDGSGSMNQPEKGDTRWSVALEGVRAVVDQLPSEDLLSLGSFSDQIHWWSRGKSVNGTNWPQPIPSPRGPTNLSDVLNQLGQSFNDGLPKQLLLLTDGQAPPPDADQLVEQFKKIDLHLYLLAIGEGEAIDTLNQIATRTGGRMIQQMDPRQWVESADQLLRTAQYHPMENVPLTMRWSGPIPWTDPHLSSWNRVWLKPDAQLWAEAELDGKSIPLAAHWRVGLGRVAAMAFLAPPVDTAALADQLAQSPRDPHWNISWYFGPKIDLLVESAGGKWINNAALTLQLGDQSFPIPQTAPGRYELSFDAPRDSSIVTVLLGKDVLDRRALAGMYSTEFSAIGNNLNQLRELTMRSGGRLIGPDDHHRLELEDSARVISLRSECYFLGAMLILLAAVRLRAKTISFS